MRLHQRLKWILFICLLLPLFLLTQSVASTQAATAASSALPILIERVNISQTDIGLLEANGPSREAVISADGRYVAFTTTATNLDPGVPSSGGLNVFVRDRTLAETKRIGTVLDEDPYDPNTPDNVDGLIDISADGNIIAFVSPGHNIRIYDQASKTFRTIVDAYEPISKISLSASGEYIAFISEDEYLVDDNLNTNGFADVFVVNIVTGINSITRISKGFDGTEADGSSLDIDISGDGEYVVFSSQATNLVDNDVTGEDVFLYTRSTGDIEQVAVGPFATGYLLQSSASPTISDDGSTIVFETIHRKPNLPLGQDLGKAIFYRSGSGFANIVKGVTLHLIMYQ